MATAASLLAKKEVEKQVKEASNKDGGDGFHKSGSTGKHNAETGTLDREMLEVPKHSASTWRDYLKSPEFETHPYAYLSGIHLAAGALGAGKSSLVYNVLAEFSAIMKPEHVGRILYYSGSGSDKILESYRKNDAIEIFDRKSKESFITALRELQTDASDYVGDGAKSGQLPPHNIIVVDDGIMDSDIIAPSIRSETPMSQILMSVRHLPATVILTSQKWTAFPSFARSNASHVYVFATRSPEERTSLSKAVNFTPNEFNRALDSLTSPNEFIWCQSLQRKLVRGISHSLVS